jgi:hypothetical protein
LGEFNIAGGDSRPYLLSLRSKTAQQLLLIERADAPVTTGSPHVRARPFFRGLGKSY